MDTARLLHLPVTILIMVLAMQQMGQLAIGQCRQQDGQRQLSIQKESHMDKQAGKRKHAWKRPWTAGEQMDKDT